MAWRTRKNTLITISIHKLEIINKNVAELYKYYYKIMPREIGAIKIIYGLENIILLRCQSWSGLFKIRNWQADSKIHMETQGSRAAKTILTRKNKIGWLKLPVFDMYCKATLVKTVWYRHKDKWIKEQNRQSTSRPTHTQSISNKGDNEIQWKEENLFNKWCCSNLLSILKRMWTTLCYTWKVI